MVVFLAESLGYGDLGCYGNATHRTPHIDRLAAQGVRFTDFHSNGIMCSPSRAALLTGLYPQRVGIEFPLNHHTRDLPPMVADACTYGHAFRDAGYRTGFFGSSHTGYLPENSPLRLGFDEFWGFCGGMDHHSHVTRWGRPNWWHGEQLEAEEGYASDLIANHAIEFMRRNRSQPFCLHIADFVAHFPLQGPKDAPVFQVGGNYDTEDRKYGIRRDRQQAHREMIEAMDTNIGKIIACIEELGLAESTLFVLSSDHGGHHLSGNNAPLAGAKGSVLEGGHRVPAIACWPGTLAPGRVIDDTATLMDLFPTFCELCRLPEPGGTPFDGVSLWPLLSQEQPLPARTLCWRQGEQKAVRDGPWKLCVDRGGVRLHDLAVDLGETLDLSAAQPAVVARLMQALAAWEGQIPPPPVPGAWRASPWRGLLFEPGSSFAQCHASTLAQLADGRFVAAFFAGTKEGHVDTAIWFTQRAGEQWTVPRRLFKVSGEQHWNPVLFVAPDNVLHLWFKVGPDCARWKSWHAVSRDGGDTWSDPAPFLHDECLPRGPVRNQPIVTSEGVWLAGASDELRPDADGRSWWPFIDRSEDGGHTWTATPIPMEAGAPSGKGGIQPALWESVPGHVHCLLRTGLGAIYRSDSSDGGRTWCAAYRTAIPNNNSGIAVARLPDGRLALACNPVAGDWAARTPLRLSLSPDNGVTWTHHVDLASGPGEFSYPAVVATATGVAATWTDRRTSIAFWHGAPECAIVDAC